MKLKKIIYGCIPLLLVGCTSSVLGIPDIVGPNLKEAIFTTKENTSPDVSSTKAADIASKFMGRPSSRALLNDVNVINGKNGKPAMYVINFPEGGFVVVSASKDYYPILAHSASGRLDMDKLDDNGLGLWFDIQGEIISRSEMYI